jgi:hypothetical protein
MLKIKTREHVINTKFHLAIPSINILQSMEFYSQLGCKIGRFTTKFAIIDFFDHQVVCHKVDEIEKQKGLYPRHFGLVINVNDWRYLLSLIQSKSEIRLHEGPYTRYEDKNEEHHTFFIKDPSENLIEFKYYEDEKMI